MKESENLTNIGMSLKKYKIKKFSNRHYSDAIALWKEEANIGVSDADQQNNINIYLKKNKGLSFVATHKNKIVGTILCGTDWRRGYINHFIVKKQYRNQGIGTELLIKSLNQLKSINISRCYIFIYSNNKKGIKYWQKVGFQLRTDLHAMSNHTF